MLEISKEQYFVYAIVRIHEKIAYVRTGYLHKVATEIIKNHNVIGSEYAKKTQVS